MAWLILARVVIVGVLACSAALLAPLPVTGVANAFFGAAIGGAIVALEYQLRRTSTYRILGAILGGFTGWLAAEVVDVPLAWLLSRGLPPDLAAFVHGVLILSFTYVGVVMGTRRGEWLEPSRLIGLFRSAGPERRYKILDTSVIIDGRIADICETGFADGTLVVPQFVLKELQFVADSSDALKRNRGRRGLDILQKIQKMASVEVLVSDMDFPNVREVDLKLIELARAMQGKIVTNDFNLNKVAQLRGIEVLNINELANALKPVVLPGESMKVFILKEGKEYNQGVAYLDDGTMVVVDNARRLIGKTIDVIVTSVLQTTAGKMIFGRHIDPNAPQVQPQGPPPQAQQRTPTSATGTNGASPASGPVPAASARRPRSRARRPLLRKPRRSPCPCAPRVCPRSPDQTPTPHRVLVPLAAHDLLVDPDHRRVHQRAGHDLLHRRRPRG